MFKHEMEDQYMKKIRLVNAFLFMICIITYCTACNSTVTPIPDEYTGTYNAKQYGSMVITSTTVSSSQLLLPQCVIGGTYCEGLIVSWEKTAFNYYSNQTFDFSPYLVSTSGEKGNSKFTGDFLERTDTYDLYLKYYDGKKMWFARNK